MANWNASRAAIRPRSWISSDPSSRCAGAGRQHQRTRDGVDHGYVRHAQAPYHHRGRDRQADGLGRIARAPGSHRPRLHDCLRGPPAAGARPAGTRVVIQGFGNVGGMAAKLMAANGFKIVALIEYDGAVYNPKGLDIAALAEHRRDTGSINEFSGGEAIDKRKRCSPTATCCCRPRRRTSSPANADRLRCSILCEGANGPTTATADEILAGKKFS